MISSTIDVGKIAEDIEYKCCDNPNIIVNLDGIKVCKNCGVTHGSSIVDEPRRAFTPEEKNERRRSEIVWRNFGARTVISKEYKDSRGNYLAPRRKRMFQRLSKINRSLNSSLERNYWVAKPTLQALGSKLNLPQYIIDTAWRIYKPVVGKKLTLGRTIKGFITAALYAAIRIHDFPRLLEEVVEIAQVPRVDVHRSLSIILQKILPELKLKYNPITPITLVYRFGNDLGISIMRQNNAVELLKCAIDGGLRRGGKDPKGLAAAALYVSLKDTDEKVTQKELAKIAMITEVTLRARAKQISKCL